MMTNLQPRLEKAELRMQILRWRDHHEILIESVLRTNLPMLKSDIEKKVALASHSDFYLRRSRWFQSSLSPVISDWVSQQWSDIRSSASSDVLRILNPHGQATSCQPQRLRADDSAIHALAEPGTTAMTVIRSRYLGRLQISAPFGSTALFSRLVIATMMLVGGYRATHFRQRAEKHFCENLFRQLDVFLFGDLRSGRQHSLCRSMQNVIADSANGYLKEL